MAVPRTTLWSIQPHTQAKHAILRRYLQAWLPIMARYNGRIVFIDGFAGPGRYSGGEEGSPVIALRTLLDHRHFAQPRAGREVVFLFIEEDLGRAGALRDELAAFEAARPLPGWMRVAVRQGEFANHVREVLDTVQAGGHRLAPTFLFVDPFGFAGIPMDVIARVVRNPRCECLVSFMFESVNRFLTSPDPRIQGRFDELFGAPVWRDVGVIPNPAERRAATVELYRRRLSEAAGLQHVRSFEMINEGNRTEYFLCFGTNSREGFSKMKEAMWRADPVQGQVFSDLTDRRQTVLLEPAPDLGRLRLMLREQFRGRGEVSIEDVERFVLFGTPYSETMHLKRLTLAPMEREGTITARHLWRDRRQYTYPANTLITFVELNAYVADAQKRRAVGCWHSRGTYHTARGGGIGLGTTR